MKISYIVTVRPERRSFSTLLNCLYNQTSDELFELLTIPIQGEGWYDHINEFAKFATGDWLCFPNDDSYFVPTFQATLLGATLENKEIDMVFCDILYDPRLGGAYNILKTSLGPCKIDKTCFIVKRSVFEAVGGFPKEGDPYYRDWKFIEKLIKGGYKFGKIESALVVHN